MFNPERTYSQLNELGVRWARVQTGWSRCETEPGVFDFGWLDDICDKLLSIGIRPYFSVSFGNQLYMPGIPHESAVGCIPLHYGPQAVRAWQRYVARLAKNFADRVSHWEVWNEPNIPQFWSTGPVSGREYAELVRLTAEPIRNAIPEAVIIGGAMSLVDTGFLDSALEAGLAGHIDKLSFHPYQPVPERNLQRMHGLIRRLLDKHTADRKIDIIQGENGCPSQLDGHHDDWLGLYDIDEEIQAKWIARRLLADLSLDFDLVFYFHLVDLMERPYRQAGAEERDPVMMGVLNGRTYQPKASYGVLQRICGIFDERTERATLGFWMDDVSPQQPPRAGILSEPYVASFVRDGYPIVAYWLAEDPQQRFAGAEISVQLWHDAELHLDHPVIVDTLTGEVYELGKLAEDAEFEETDWRSVGKKYRLPIADYPLLVTDRCLVESLISVAYGAATRKTGTT